ncbi:hypothetical protein EAF00_005418 [Botryotinia globosa]|nr:hypothetical protein EAF00_005418 [Botryotinia globosa]
MTTQQASKSESPDEKIFPTMDTSHSSSKTSISQITDHTSWDTSSGSPVEIRELKSALVSIPQEIRDMIYSYLLVNPVLGQAASVSSETTYGNTQKYDLGPAILCVCKQTYREGISILYKNPIFIDCSNSPGDWDLQDGIFEKSYGEIEEDRRNGIREPYIINLCPLTRYSNWEPEEHQDKTLFRDTPSIEKVKKDFSSNVFAEFCVSVSSYPNISLNISILPMNFHKDQTKTTFSLDEGLAKNLLPLKMIRNIKTLVIKCAELPVIPDYCYDRDDQGRKTRPADLSVPDLPSPELISEYEKLTSRDTPIIECLGLLGARLNEYFWLFHRAEIVLIDRESVGIRRNIRVHDASILPPETAVGGIVIQEDEQSFLDCGELVDAMENSPLENTETAEDVLRLKQYRRKLLEVLEPEYQNIRAHSIRFREFFRNESGPTGIFVIGPSKAVDRLDYWSRVTRAMEELERYEYSFVRGKTEKLRLSLAEGNKHVLLAYHSGESAKLMKKIAWAYERRRWKNFMFYYKIAIRRMEKFHFKLRWYRVDLFKWDISDRGSDLDAQYDEAEAIVWPKPESNAELDREYIMEISKGETSDEDLDDYICVFGNADYDHDDQDNH